MFLYDDLDFYKNKKFRASYYILYIWNLFEGDLIYLLGLSNSLNVSIICDIDKAYLNATSNFCSLLDKKYEIDIQHSLSLCENLSAEIHLNIVRDNTNFNVKYSNNNLYYSNSLSDEGIIEVEADVQCNIDNFFELKKSLLTSLAKLYQFSICRNILYLEIESENATATEIDADYEIVKTLQTINNTTFSNALNAAKSLYLIHHDNIIYINEIHDLIKDFESI